MFDRGNRRNPNKTINDILYSGSILEKILNSKKIKYTVLDSLFKNTLPVDKDTVTMYIDLNNIFNSFYNPQNLEKFKTINDSEKMAIASEVLNIAAHYRNYFATRHDMFTNFIFYCSTEIDHRSVDIYPSYKEGYYMKRIHDHPDFTIINNILRTQLKLISIIAKYIPHVYFIDTKDINSDIVPYLGIQDQQENEVGIIYSNNILASLNLIGNNDVYLLTCRGDNSKFINNIDIVEYVTKKDIYSYSNNLLPYIFAITGYKTYNIEGIKGYGVIKASNVIDDLIKVGKLSDINYLDIDMFISDLSKVDIFNEKQLNIIARNVKLLKPEFIIQDLTEYDISNILEFNMIDLIDSKSLLELNTKYFNKYPIMLKEIMMGEQYE